MILKCLMTSAVFGIIQLLCMVETDKLCHVKVLATLIYLFLDNYFKDQEEVHLYLSDSKAVWSSFCCF